MSDRTAQHTPPTAAPRYKLALITWAGAFAVITLILDLLGPTMAGWPLMLRTLLISVLMVTTLTWLVSLALTLRMAREKLGPEAGEAGRLLDRSRRELDEALKEIRELARGIHPTLLSERGLGAAVEALAHRAPLPVEVGELPAQRLPEQVELAAYFVVSEALTNVAKHASATHVSVTVTNGDGRLAVEVSDDGVGGADIALGTGLRGLSDRLTAINGQFDIDFETGP